MTFCWSAQNPDATGLHTFRQIWFLPTHVGQAGVCSLMCSSRLQHAALLSTVQDRSMLPVTLCVARLSGVGSDTLFIGVLRREAGGPMTSKEEVKVTARQTAFSHFMRDEHAHAALTLAGWLTCTSTCELAMAPMLITLHAVCDVDSFGQRQVA